MTSPEDRQVLIELASDKIVEAFVSKGLKVKLGGLGLDIKGGQLVCLYGSACGVGALLADESADGIDPYNYDSIYPRVREALGLDSSQSVWDIMMGFDAGHLDEDPCTANTNTVGYRIGARARQKLQQKGIK